MGRGGLCGGAATPLGGADGLRASKAREAAGRAGAAGGVRLAALADRVDFLKVFSIARLQCTHACEERV